jgi:predicted nucleic acid-binding Zn ribbon protein
MTWAKNFSDRFAIMSSQTGKRAKPLKHCANPECGVGIERRKKFCSPCYAERQAKAAAERKRRAKLPPIDNTPAKQLVCIDGEWRYV